MQAKSKVQKYIVVAVVVVVNGDYVQQDDEEEEDDGGVGGEGEKKQIDKNLFSFKFCEFCRMRVFQQTQLNLHLPLAVCMANSISVCECVYLFMY